MGILVNKDSKVIVQGMTGSEGAKHSRAMKEFGTQVVAGVTPGKGGQTFEDWPIYNSVAEAKAKHGADVSIIFVPPAGAADAVLEAAHAGIPLIVLITEGVPTVDMMRAVQQVKELDQLSRAQGGKGIRLIGGNCPGLVTNGECKVGIMPNRIYTNKGRIGLISRSGTLTYEAAKLLNDAGMGTSTTVGIGGDPVIGTTFADVLPMFEEDPDTDAIIVIGEIGGADEEAAAEYIAQNMKKPVVAFISGRSAPKGKRMGHAGAIIMGDVGTPESKLAAFKAANVPVADTMPEIIDMVKAALNK
ncbi:MULTISPECIES: succinate--CoA ligase subunit alpha [Deinococcus]|jgi:succinyl-CoA synthetase alpha subunit|uniref:Succinate--CoA ligase [ADP-forming] subunit alpha n=2 Tax=Deinococcus TaxID=1298 RepID=A0A221SVT7_9DEIO|nr:MULTISPECIES: succinate--CoA ligase subunit alpha [Deinococcus]ASN80740.1 succinate--CoA ligase subunit alpha [Deinococcus ficus]MDP9762723.1 succinyl-CoA synthetase alpha subunit [Deinococcus enclensis]GHF70100.1 succinate--CoA ligase [ADP-forming] subunit alpha [Deinococcus ficus]